MSNSPFDTAASTYRRVVNDAIGSSGETVEFFAHLKTGLMQATLAPHVPANILDYGCGIGLSTAALAQSFPASALTGCDESLESIALAATGPAAALGARFVGLEGHRLPFPNESFDAAFAACVFHHIEPAQRLHWAKEIRRVLKPGGTLHIFEHNPLNPLTRQVVRRVPFDKGVRLLGMREVQRLLHASGFTIQHRRYYFFFPGILRSLRRFEVALRWLPLGGQHYVLAVR